MPQLLAVVKTAIPSQFNESQSGWVCDDGGLYLKNQGRYGDAELLYKRALEIYIKVLGKEHSNTQICLQNLTIFYESHNQTAAIHELMKKFAE